MAAAKKIYFIGIGGAGVSAVARLALAAGQKVFGSDARESEITRALSAAGAKIFIGGNESVRQTGEKSSRLTADFDLVIYTVAAEANHPQRRQARQWRLSQLSYPQYLGSLIKEKYGIGVSGTNGKTTTTAMLARIFIAAGEDPTVVVGSPTAGLNGNARAGRGKYFIFESDEYRRAFAHYGPAAAAVTYVGLDHLDYYHNLADIKSAFHDYLARLPAIGLAAINADDKNSLAVSQKIRARVVKFGLLAGVDYRAVDLCVKAGRQSFKVFKTVAGIKGEGSAAAGAKNQLLGEIILKIPGEFNVYNALAAITIASELGIKFAIMKKSLAGFGGAARRFELLGSLDRAKVIADYAHTPDAVAKTIAAAKEFYRHKKVLAVFQPHQYSRTKKLFAGFAQAFGAADKAIISDIFYVVGRENPADFNVSAKKLAVAINKQSAGRPGDKVKAIWGGDLAQTEKLIRQEAKNFDLILMLGAGDIYESAKNLIKIKK